MKDKETGLEIYGIPNAETLAAMKEADEITRNHRARFSRAEELFASLEGPIVVKDEETGLQGMYCSVACTNADKRGKAGGKGRCGQ
jgi:hypothetical protein